MPPRPPTHSVYLLCVIASRSRLLRHGAFTAYVAGGDRVNNQDWLTVLPALPMKSGSSPRSLPSRTFPASTAALPFTHSHKVSPFTSAVDQGRSLSDVEMEGTVSLLFVRSCASCKSPVSSKMPARSLKVVTASASYNNYKLRDKEMSHCWGWVLGGKQFMTPFLVYVFYLIQGLCGCHKQVLGLLLLLFYFLFFILIVKRDVGARWAMTVMA